MKWIDDLEEVMREHLMEFHLDQPDIREEVRYFVDFLVYDKFSEGEHTICCPYVGCNWETKFQIKYHMIIGGIEE